MKNSLTISSEFGADSLDGLVALLNQIDIPENLVKEIQEIINSLNSQIGSLTESEWGENI